MSWDEYKRDVAELLRLVAEEQRNLMGISEAWPTPSSVALEAARNFDALPHADDVPVELRQQVLTAGRPTISRAIRPLALHELR